MGSSTSELSVAAAKFYVNSTTTREEEEEEEEEEEGGGGGGGGKGKGRGGSGGGEKKMSNKKSDLDSFQTEMYKIWGLRIEFIRVLWTLNIRDSIFAYVVYTVERFGGTAEADTILGRRWHNSYFPANNHHGAFLIRLVCLFPLTAHTDRCILASAVYWHPFLLSSDTVYSTLSILYSPQLTLCTDST